jgi:formate hydrogenlyase transcriptional activator
VIVATGDTVEVDPLWLKPPAAAPALPAAPPGLAEVERRTILDALARCGGKIYGTGGAAALLGLKPTTLYGKMRKLRIPRQPSAGNNGE